MFIPRTLNEVRRPGDPRLWRAIGVAGIVAVALFLVLSANITLGQENLEAGQIAERDIRAQRDATFDSASETEALREEAAAAVQPVTEVLEPPADNQEDQLAAFDMVVRRVTRILELRDSGTIDAAEAGERLAADAPEIRAAHRPLLAEMAVPRWEAVAGAGRSALQSTLANEVREDEVAAFASRSSTSSPPTWPIRSVHWPVTLPPRWSSRTSRSMRPRPSWPASARAREVPPVVLTIQAGETIVREGDLLTVGDIEKLEELGLTRPSVQAGTVIGQRAHRGADRVDPGRLPLALRARGLAPHAIGPPLLPGAGGDRCRDPHRGRSRAVGLRRADRGDGAAHRHPARAMRRASPWPVPWRCWRAS